MPVAKHHGSLILKIKPHKQFQSVWQFLAGNYRLCEFALTNICVSQCSFCGIWKQQPKIMVDKDKALQTIDILAGLGVRFLTLTGGEPLVHPNVIEFVGRCTERGMVTAILDADPRLLTAEKITGLKSAGADMVCISIDHYTDGLEYQARKIENLLKQIETAVSLLQKAGITSFADILISNFNHNELQKLFDKCNELGFDYIGINYPEHSLSPVYELGGEMVSLKPKETIVALREVIGLKKKGYRILNSIDSVENIIKFLENKPVDYYCLGGNRVLFVDWFFNVYPCMHLAESMGTIWELNPERLIKAKCNACNMSWYRDFSIYFDGMKSLRPLIRSL